MMKEKRILQKVIYFLPFFGIAGFIITILYGYSLGIFKSVETLQAFIDQQGQFAVFFFILLQTLQVIVPILPGGISSVVGLLMFGNGMGLLYSYVGLIIGEVIVYWLARYYGKPFAKLILSPKKYRKFENLLERSPAKVKKLLIFTLLIPFAPDDLVCLVAGLSDFPFKDYMKILLIFKFWSVATYSFALLYLFEHFSHF